MKRIGIWMLALFLPGTALSFGLADDRQKLDDKQLQKKATDLVKQLGDPIFRKREAAAKELLELGLPAQNALKVAFENPDVEIRERAHRLYPEVELVTVRRKLKTLREDKTGQLAIDLPGWKLFQNAVGSNDATRTLFLDIYQQNIDLLSCLESDPIKANELYANRCAELYKQQQMRYQIPRTAEPKIDFHQFMALLLVSMNENVRKVQAQPGKVVGGVRMIAVPYPISLFMTESFFSEYLNAHSQSDQFKKMFLSWLEIVAVPGKNDNNLYYAVQAIKSAKIKEALPFVEKSLKKKIENGGSTTLYFMLALGMLGEKKHLSVLEPYLKDSTFVWSHSQNGLMYRTEIRDVALAMTLYLSGEKLTEFNFEVLKSYGGAQVVNFEPYMFGFIDEESRQKTFDKWEGFKKGKDTLETLPFPKSISEIKK